MADCEKNILEIPLSFAQIAPVEVLIFTLPNGVSVTRPWSAILGSINSNDIDFVVPAIGTVAGGITTPGQGDSIYINPALTGRVRVYRNGQKLSTIVVSGGYYYSFNQVETKITFIPSVNETELISIEPY